ncbi:MAG: hypothetical protein QOE31_4003 [Solirubrobacteraceae bacterium]|nr:hypothetical protein [Solirubrobacteraceae bacterium]
MRLPHHPSAHKRPADGGHAQHHGHHEAGGHEGSGRTNLVRLLLVLCLAQLMVVLDITAVNVALPDLADGLSIDGSNISWAITSYSLVFGSLLLLGGRAADLLGRRRMFLAGLTIFTVASVASALATGAASLFTARAFQGVGAALLSPAALSIIMAGFTGGRERAHALGAWGAVGGAGAAVGVLLGGALTELVGWQAIFAINIPVGILLAVAAVKIVPADQQRPQWRGLDLRGAALATASLGAIVFALSQATDAGWTSLQTLGVTAAGVLGLAAFTLVELHAPQPLLRIQRLTDRGIGGGFVMMLAAAGVLFGSFLLVSLYLQNVLGSGPLVTGLAFLPLAVAIGAGVHAGSQIVTQRGVRIPMAASFAVVAAGMLLLSHATSGGSYVIDVLPGLLIAGVGLGIVLICVSVSVMTGAAEHEAGMLSGLNTTGHEIGGSIGIAILATVATGSHASTVTALADGISDGFLAAACIAAGGAVVALLILPSAATFLPKLRLAPRVAVH